MSLLERLVEVQVPDAVKLSPDAQHILYSTRLLSGIKKDEHEVSTLWIVETGKPNSARQLTSGLYHDRAPAWHPNGESMAFLSDRAEKGKKTAIYSLGLRFGGEVIPITPSSNEAEIDQFEYSPNGEWIAYISPDEETEQEKARKEAKDDVMVWGQNHKPARLRLVHVESKETTVLVDSSEHITGFCLNDNGTKIAFASTPTTSIESPQLYGTTVSIVSVLTKQVDMLFSIPNDLSDLTWSYSDLYFIAKVSLTDDQSSDCVYSVDTNAPSASPKRIAHGIDDCAAELRKFAKDVAVHALRGLRDEIYVLKGGSLISNDKDIRSWDVRFDLKHLSAVLAFVTSDATKLPEIYTVIEGRPIEQVTNHGRAFASHNFGSCQQLTCRSADGKVELEGVYLLPPIVADSTPRAPLPTIVFIHGGPYYRIVNSYDPCGHLWSPILLDAGFGILLANYRGSSGRGEKFAAAGRGACGTCDYDDVVTMTQVAIEQGLADSERLAVAGWSQGGCLSLLAAVRNGLHGAGWKFKAAVSGAGMSDNDTMCYTSDLGSTLQDVEKSSWMTSQSDVSGRKGSAIWEFRSAAQRRIIPPVLLLHGEEDKRVPLEQSVAFRRALESAHLPFEMAVYPREGHGLDERQHVLDAARRLMGFIQKYVQ